MKTVHITVKDGGKTEIKTLIPIENNKPLISVLNEFENILLNVGVKRNSN
jgi:hypothetical protein